MTWWQRHGVTTQVWVRWTLAYAVVTGFFSIVRVYPELHAVHGVLVYLLLIVGASREEDQWLAVVMVVASYIAFDWLFIPPVRAIGKPTQMDFVVLLGFLLTAASISRLVLKLQNTAMVATARAAEIERLSAERLQLEMEASRAEVLRETERLKNALIASITHDLRTPLQTLTMLADPASGVDSRTALSKIGDETRRLADFVSAMRKFAFTHAQTDTPVVVESHVVDDLVGTAVRSREDTLRGHAVSIALPTDPPMVLVRCDFTLTLQILANLLENAARYAPGNSPIDVIVRARETQVEIVVADRGPGLSPREAVAVFKPLQRGDAAQRSNTGGTGMGLAISRTFATAQKGDLQFRPRIGGGSEFVLILPGASLSAPAPTPQPTALIA